MFYGDNMFYSEAMNLFQKAGHTISAFPVYVNHTYEQVVYFDSEKNILLEPLMINTIEKALCISHLFDLEDENFGIGAGSRISYYSIVLKCERSSRSQTAHDIHFILHSAFASEISIVLFNHNDDVLLSIAGFGNDIILSDWYLSDTEYESLVELIHIAQLSLKSSYEFISDLIYLVAREYYKRPAFWKFEVYDLIPSYYFCSDTYFKDNGNRESIKDLIKRLAVENQQQYGDDYVEPITERIHVCSDLDVELDMLSLELDMEEEIPSDEVTEDETIELEDKEHDVYEYEDVAPEIFKDPSLMLKWFDKGN